jgi:hypothetical protein
LTTEGNLENRENFFRKICKNSDRLGNQKPAGDFLGKGRRKPLPEHKGMNGICGFGWEFCHTQNLSKFDIEK